MSPPVGLYAWGGPGTIRLLRAKYRAPRIDEESFLRLYAPGSLKAARENLGVTDMWVTYSWGFSDQTEAPDRRFLRDRLPSFREQGIRTHAYVQGLNVVTSEFSGRDVFCRDPDDRLLPYSRSRSLTCPNNPAARRVILDRVAAACGEDVDGVFLDNIIFGIPPFFVRRDFMSFFGCSCRFCRSEFQTQFGYPLATAGKSGTRAIADFLGFRRSSVAALLREAADVCRAAGKQFGANLYDPLRHTPEIYFGYRLADIAPLLDYHLIENHALDGSGGISNGHLAPLISSTDRPVFVVSYRQGIGFEPAYGAAEVDAIFSDAGALGYSPCLKVSEFTTNGLWHALDLTALRPPAPSLVETRGSAVPARRLRLSSLAERVVARAVGKRYAQLARAAFENDAVAYVLAKSGFAPRSLRHDRYFLLGTSGA